MNAKCLHTSGNLLPIQKSLDWINMIKMALRTGKLVDLENLDNNDINIEDIAHALSMQCRYNSKVKKFYSVAEHSVILTRYARDELNASVKMQKTLLLHDAGEAFCGDVIYHLKQRLPEFRDLEDKVISQIFKKFGLSYQEAETHCG